MKFELPVCFTVSGRYSKVRNAALRTITIKRSAVIDVPDARSDEVVLVAEWKQKWDRHSSNWCRSMSSNSTSWIDQFAEDPDLARLISTQGRFYAPVKVRTGSDHKPLSSAGLVGYVTGEISGGTVFETSLSASIGAYAGALQSVSSPIELEELAVEKDGLSVAMERLEGLMASFIIVDDMVWQEIDEPILVVRGGREGILSINSAQLLRSLGPEMLFSMSEFNDASEYLSDNWPFKSTRHQIKDVNVFSPESLSGDVTRSTVERSFRFFIDEFGQQLRFFSREVTNLWYDALEQLGSKRKRLSDDQLDAIAKALHDLASTIDRKNLDKNTVNRLDGVHRAVDRWNLRVIGGAKLTGGVRSISH